MRLPSKLLFIADMDAAGDRLFPILQAALEGGCTWVLLRGVSVPYAKFLAAARQARLLCGKHQATLFISRDAAVAQRVKADGLHLASDQRVKRVPKMMLGQSCHNETELRRAANGGADYVFLSPVFTPSGKKSMTPPMGMEKFTALVKKSPVPVCALGGITPENAGLCLKAGAKAVAVLGGIINADDPCKQVKFYLKYLK